MRRHRTDLPISACRFLRIPEGDGLEPIVRRFHRWLDEQKVDLTVLQASDVERFFERPFRKLVKPRTAQVYKRGLIRYLDWQHEKGTILFDPRRLEIRRRNPLPPLALAFVRSLEPTLRPGTCASYREGIGLFHRWLDETGIKLKQIDRPHLEHWFQSMNDRGLHPWTRIRNIQNVRVYFRWLYDRKQLKRHPEELIRRGDFPKLPSYLPRPLRPDVDSALQEWWEASNSPLSQGLLLMRHTGLRVGELLALTYDCTRLDPMGHQFLEVPLGKLNNERMVPLSEKTCEVIAKLHGSGSQFRAYLLEKVPGKKATYDDVRRALSESCKELKLEKAATSHQLRHTYATSLLNGGMSLVGIMKLLGHRDYRMTLRYAAITQETIRKEYFEALIRLESKYGIDTKGNVAFHNEMDPVRSLRETIAWTQKNIGHDKACRRLANSVVKRLRRIQADLQVAMDWQTS